MSILAILIPLSLVLLTVAVTAFVWAVRRGQFDDLETPAIDILADDSAPRHVSESVRDPHAD
ncbi:MAG: cbb3-type cytochrome oxidase assembly protein CcoS [Gammaproteobacteria bacterium HGW-Gammaproteobacteria-2]|jgi:cbb3-type cytochrome oxidase maturation protein|nr:MAG: cbb3-type cytochrome oxidase assembly protein CcoS [Gammaproteobacteria bacterium HGW-Gammaproteobacteria-2]